MINFVFTFIGAPGAGKGYFSHWMIEKFSFKRLSSGDITRKFAAESTEIGLKIASLLKRGVLLPDDMISELFFLELEKIHTNVILDGYPRTRTQGTHLHSFLRKHMPRNNFVVVVLESKKDVAAYRVQGRVYCPTCGATYHPELNPSKNGSSCDKDHTKLLKRTDDEHFEDRWSTYEQRTVPLLKFMKTFVKPDHWHVMSSDLTKEQIKAKLTEIIKKSE